MDHTDKGVILYEAISGGCHSENKEYYDRVLEDMALLEAEVILED